MPPFPLILMLALKKPLMVLTSEEENGSDKEDCETKHEEAFDPSEKKHHGYNTIHK